MTVTMSDAAIDPDRMMLDRIDTSGEPLFTVSEMARFFFARTNHWVRWQEQRGGMEITDPDGTRRTVGTGRTTSGARQYTLSDVEEVAHALAQNGGISGARLRQTLTLIKIQAEMHEYL